ncbi:MAG TPA: hypothetical protein VHJ18_30335 [Streptosporangiaceae bacterium]|nr:hypothetical protein [Streptosporangiaceae bacterium]
MGAPEYQEFLDLADRYPGVYLGTTMACTDANIRIPIWRSLRRWPGST